jgi:hypothetical protein
MKICWHTNDRDLRTALLYELHSLHGHDPHTVIIQELAIRHGSSRVDLAVVNGTLHGYELKSDRDDLQRLPEQVAAYAAVFDLVTLVVGERHLRRALDLIPEWWGIRVARIDASETLFCDLKLPLTNPSPDPMSLARLLWRNEAMKLARDLSLPIGRNNPRREWIYTQVAHHPDLDFLRARIRDCLRSRPNWRSDALQP